MQTDHEEYSGPALIKEYFEGIWRDRYILMSLVKQDLQLKYKRSVLGIAWAIITPLGLVLIIGVVWTMVFGADPRVFIPLLFSGLNTWLFINASADGGSMALLAAEGYLKQTTVNAQIFPIRVALVAFINLLYAVLTFFGIYLFLQPEAFGISMLMCIPGLAIVLIFCIALANFASIANLYFRDFQPLQGLILQAFFYATPIIYPAQVLQDRGFSIIYQINPFYYFIEIVRRPMMGNGPAQPVEYAVAIIIAAALFLISVLVVMRLKKHLAFKY